MITLRGVLTIRIVSGRYGDFRVGRLITGIGEFSIKDAVLAPYAEGSYEGHFGIGRIYPSHFTAGGRLIIEIRAELQTITLDDSQPEERYDPLLEQDFTEEKPATDFQKQGELPEDAQDAPLTETLNLVNQEELATDQQLFGLLWPLGEQVKLDKTLDRNLIRQQRDRLYALGYQFKAIGQVWVKG